MHWAIRIPRIFSTTVHVEDPESTGVFVWFQLEAIAQCDLVTLSRELDVPPEEINFGPTDASVFILSPHHLLPNSFKVKKAAYGKPNAGILISIPFHSEASEHDVVCLKPFDVSEINAE